VELATGPKDKEVILTVIIILLRDNKRIFYSSKDLVKHFVEFISI